jgi:DNA replication protein DnaC
MERSQVLDAMGQLKLYGMRTAYDEIIATAVKRQHEPQRIIGDLLTAEISEKQARSIKYQMTIAKLPLAKEIKEFDFEAAEVNETLIRDLATGDFLDHQRNLVLIGGTGTGKTHLAVSIARACIRNGRRGRFFNVVDLVNKLDAEARAERQGRTADLISRLDFLILDELPIRGHDSMPIDTPFAIVARTNGATRLIIAPHRTRAARTRLAGPCSG